MKLTLGLAVYDDYRTTALTIQAIRIQFLSLSDSLRSSAKLGPELDGLEVVVVDNNPESPQGKDLKNFCRSVNAIYVEFPEPKGPALAKNEIFNHGCRDKDTDNIRIVFDSHILPLDNCLESVIQHAINNPEDYGLWHGQLMFNQLDYSYTHLDNVWGDDLMWGVWGKHDPRADDQLVSSPPTKDRLYKVPAKPFQIAAHGMGGFACRLEAWAQLPDQEPNQLRGFGGEEFCIHEFFRKRGKKIWCIPGFRYWHLFRGENEPPTFECSYEDRLHNYLVWFNLLGMPISTPVSKFLKVLPKDTIYSILKNLSLHNRISLKKLYDEAGIKDLESPPAGRQIIAAEKPEKPVEKLAEKLPEKPVQSIAHAARLSLPELEQAIKHIEPATAEIVSEAAKPLVDPENCTHPKIESMVLDEKDQLTGKVIKKVMAYCEDCGTNLVECKMNESTFCKHSQIHCKVDRKGTRYNLVVVCKECGNIVGRK